MSRPRQDAVYFNRERPAETGQATEPVAQATQQGASVGAPAPFAAHHSTRTRARVVYRRTISDKNEIAESFHRSDFEEAWKRYLPSAPEKAATVATSATHERRNVAAVADVAASA